MESKYLETINSFNVETDEARVSEKVNKILEEHLDENRTPDVLKFLFSSIDLTTLKSTDSMQSVSAFTERVNQFENDYGELPSVAGICVFPVFAPVVRSVLDVSSVKIVTVSGGFPSSQTFPEVKVAETALAVEGGADEIDIVMNLGNFFDKDYQEVSDEIEEIRHACRNARLKVILETGALKTPENIKAASVLALYSGAAFLKTSTGKDYSGASLEAVYVMAHCIKQYYERTKIMVGIKAAGGVATTEEALKYYTVVKEVLGDKWLDPDYFRLGASRLANNLLSDILGSETHYF